MAHNMQLPSYPAPMMGSQPQPLQGHLYNNNYPASYPVMPKQHVQYSIPVPVQQPIPEAIQSNQPPPPPNIPQLADFASTMVYTMWHTRRPSVTALYASSPSVNPATLPTEAPNKSGSPHATTPNSGSPSPAFKKFCLQVLNATQLSESVVLLSLKYIAKLLIASPSIQGAEGSEYRLFVVALMLANKFLDDNTFTNKTWSEVTTMKVQDLDVMEIEFLSVLDFRLFVRDEEYQRWTAALVQYQQGQLDQQQQAAQRTMLAETTLRNMGLLNEKQQQQQQQAWVAQQAEADRRQAKQQQAMQQQQSQYLYILSQAQAPQVPQLPITGPLVRVQLKSRIPPPNMYHHAPHVLPAPATSSNTHQSPGYASGGNTFYPNANMSGHVQGVLPPGSSLPTPQASTSISGLPATRVSSIPQGIAANGFVSPGASAYASYPTPDSQPHQANFNYSGGGGHRMAYYPPNTSGQPTQQAPQNQQRTSSLPMGVHTLAANLNAQPPTAVHPSLQTSPYYYATAPHTPSSALTPNGQQGGAYSNTSRGYFDTESPRKFPQQSQPYTQQASPSAVQRPRSSSNVGYNGNYLQHPNHQYSDYDPKSSYDYKDYTNQSSNYRNGPVPEDPRTAVDSYRKR
ncbi:hypothetical protein BZG36_00132 [Bifiguratus adelaidae]|uniref:Cyclin N-terminal domain-containing protein n=1 Tax=Bifiguratus adelaidae TaxID=1938954 RepID=A0A261Y8P8_9FUNG|nr:hypothetical protein BZG36_00132 [Bifiguratus adelaidae]